MPDWKFAESSKAYHEQLNQVLGLGLHEARDYIHHYPVFAGTVNIARYLAIYEAYKLTAGLSGHMAEVGVFKGASMFMLGKLAEIFEPHSLTEVHGFDWFKGMEPDENDKNVPKGAYAYDYESIRKLVELQDLQRVIKVHKCDVTTELDAFFAENPSLMFKLVYMDAGIYAVVESCLKHFWPRLHRGGVLLLDQYNEARAPGETKAVREFFGDACIRTFPFSRQPSAYIVKP